ncbi:MAG: calcium-binding protein [Planctomycetota bacterium]
MSTHATPVERLESRRLLAADLGGGVVTHSITDVIDYETDADFELSPLLDATFVEAADSPIYERMFQLDFGRIGLSGDFIARGDEFVLSQLRHSAETEAYKTLAGGERLSDSQVQALAAETVIEWDLDGEPGKDLTGTLLVYQSRANSYAATTIEVTGTTTITESTQYYSKVGFGPVWSRTDRIHARVFSEAVFEGRMFLPPDGKAGLFGDILVYNANEQRSQNIGVSTRNGKVYFNANGQITRFAASDVGSIQIRGSMLSDRIEIGGRLPDATIIGFGGGDTLLGGPGDDRIVAVANRFGGDKVNYIDARSGDDEITVQRLRDISNPVDRTLDTIFGGSGNDFVDTRSSRAHALVYGGSGDDRFFGSNFAFVGSLFGKSSSEGDQFAGGPGNDYAEGSVGSDWLDGGSGDDTLYGQDGHDSIRGGDGDDELDGSEGNDVIDGRAGHDTMAGGRGTDRMHGGEGHDHITVGISRHHADRYNTSPNFAFGGGGNDTIIGDFGADQLFGEAGDDRFMSRYADDVRRGSSSHDRGDLVDGGDGEDAYRVRLDDLDYLAQFVTSIEDIIQLT